MKNTYDMIINGYDWGPGVDKLILHCESSYSPYEINIKDFIVSTETYGSDWSTFPPKLKLVKGERKIEHVYCCDENGNQIDSSSSTLAIELKVHPADMLSNPFLYGSDMMNHWQEIYNVEISNPSINLHITDCNRKISPLADQFLIETSETDDITLHYALWKPSSKNIKLPLIIWLHGMGEGGNDPYIALLGNKVVSLITNKVQSSFGNDGAVVLVPQVNGFWMQTKIDSAGRDNWISETSELTKSYYTNALYNLIQEVLKKNPEIDDKRIYVGGCSNGGYMTMNMLMEYPQMFAAAYPVCEAFPDCRIDDEKIKALTNQHIWFTQSKDDSTVIPEKFSIPTVKRILDAGAKDVHFTLLESVTDTTGKFMDNENKPFKYHGHFSWIYTLNNECIENNVKIFEWMSKISK